MRPVCACYTRGQSIFRQNNYVTANITRCWFILALISQSGGSDETEWITPIPERELACDDIIRGLHNNYNWMWTGLSGSVSFSLVTPCVIATSAERYLAAVFVNASRLLLLHVLLLCSAPNDPLAQLAQLCCLFQCWCVWQLCACACAGSRVERTDPPARRPQLPSSERATTSGSRTSDRAPRTYHVP